MTLAASLRKLAFNVRAIPGQLGVRPHRVSILKRSWSGPHTGDGTRTDVEIDIVEANGQPPKVRWLSDEQIAVGSLEAGTVEIGPITPRFVGGGTDLGTIDGSTLIKGEVRMLRIVGPQHPTGAVYQITRISADRALHYTIQATPVAPQ
jgi:hypothetical protein